MSLAERVQTSIEAERAGTGSGLSKLLTNVMNGSDVEGDLEAYGLSNAEINDDGSATLTPLDGGEPYTVSPTKVERMIRAGGLKDYERPPAAPAPSKTPQAFLNDLTKAGFDVSGFTEKDDKGRTVYTERGNQALDLADVLTQRGVQPKDLPRAVASEMKLVNSRDARVREITDEIAAHERAMEINSRDDRFGFANRRRRSSAIAELKLELQGLGVDAKKVDLDAGGSGKKAASIDPRVAAVKQAWDAMSDEDRAGSAGRRARDVLEKHGLLDEL